MRVFFDLDDTLICHDPATPCEPNCVPAWRKWNYREPLRLGAVALHRELINRGHEIWSYTTSYRRPRDVSRWLNFYQMPVSAVINSEIHARIRGADVRRFTKLPAHFGIALHVDDEVRAAWGERLGFRWLSVTPDDEDWTAKFLAVVDELEK